MADGNFNLSDILHENWMLEEGCSVQQESEKRNKEQKPRKPDNELPDNYETRDGTSSERRIFLTPDLTQSNSLNPPIGNCNINDLYVNHESMISKRTKTKLDSFDQSCFSYPYVAPTTPSYLKSMRTSTRRNQKDQSSVHLFQQQQQQAQMNFSFMNQIHTMPEKSICDYSIPVRKDIMPQQPINNIINSQIMYTIPEERAKIESPSTYRQPDRARQFKSEFELPTNLLDGEYEKTNEGNCDFQKLQSIHTAANEVNRSTHGCSTIVRGDYSRTVKQEPIQDDDDCVIIVGDKHNGCDGHNMGNDKSASPTIGDYVGGDGEQNDLVVVGREEDEYNKRVASEMMKGNHADMRRTTHIMARGNGLEESDNVGGVEQEGIERPAAVAGSTEDDGVASGCDDGKSMRNCSKSELEELLNQPVRQKFPDKVGEESTAKFANMQFYQPSQTQHHVPRATPPPNFAQPYGMNMQEETRQIMNLDSQQTHNSSPTTTWNSHQQYTQMSSVNAYPQRGPPIYPAAPMPHHSAPPPPTSNPYYQPPPHMQPQAPMMPPGMHAQQAQQPYFSTQSPLTGTPPSMSYGTPGMAPPSTNGNGPVFSFSKPRNVHDHSGSSGGGGGSSVNRRKKHSMNDMGSPRYGDDSDATIFPDMSDFPLLDVVQSKAKKEAGRKPCRPHLCEQSRMLISRVCHYHREFAKRLPPRHPLSGSMLSKPDQWTSQIMGVSLATVRKCIDMASDEEVFTRCTDKNLVNLTPTERTERDELLAKLSTVFEDEKSLGAGTAGLTIAEYSPRRSYSGVFRQSVDGEKSNASYNGNEGQSGDMTLLNLDEHSNNSKDLGTPTPSMESSQVLGHEMGALVGGVKTSEVVGTLPKEVKNRGRPKKVQNPLVVQQPKPVKRKLSIEGSENADDKEEMEKKTEDENESTPENEKKDSNENDVSNEIDREDDAASSEGTNRSETATPEPAATSATVKARRGKKKKVAAEIDEYVSKRKKSSAQNDFDEDSADHRMLTRARSRQP